MFSWLRRWLDRKREPGEFDDILAGLARLRQAGARVHVTPEGGVRIDRRDIAKYLQTKSLPSSEDER